MGGLLLETEQSATTHRLDHGFSHEALRLSERSGPLCDPGLAFECLAPPPAMRRRRLDAHPLDFWLILGEAKKRACTQLVSCMLSGFYITSID